MDTYARIRAVVRRIPRGRVATYGQVAEVAGMPGAARLVGYALHASQPHHALPWHRVLGAGGRLTLAKLDPDTALTQRIRLEAEGVPFVGGGRVDLERCRWKVGAPLGPRMRSNGTRPPAIRSR
ncbi:MAG: MGMT family protein [Candidatus Eisenbacteria bacterium]